MLHNFPNLFATKNSELGSTGLIKHSIDTQGKGPIDLFKVATVPQSQKSCGNLTTAHHGGG
jgi:hypothetical protein